MAKMGGCDYGMVGQSGKKAMSPTATKRNNMSKGGVNGHMGGTDKMGKRPALGVGQNGQGKYKHDKR